MRAGGVLPATTSIVISSRLGLGVTASAMEPTDAAYSRHSWNSGDATLMQAERSPKMLSEERRVVERHGQMRVTNQGMISSDVRTFAFVPLLVVCLLCAFAATVRGDAFAGPTDPVARKHLTAGNRLYRVREFEKAIEEYKAGALRESAAVFHYNLGQSYRQLGRNKEALWHYERFLDRGKPTGEVEQVTRSFIDQMRSELEKEAIIRSPIEPAPPPTGASPPPGHNLPSVSPPRERRGMPLQRKLAIGVGIAGVASAGLGVVLGLRAQSFERDAATICPMDACERSDEANELLDRGKANAVYASIAFGVSGVALLGAGVLWITCSPADHKNITIAPKVSHTFAGAAASLRF